jgi:hypothetical protein
MEIKKENLLWWGIFTPIAAIVLITILWYIQFPHDYICTKATERYDVGELVFGALHMVFNFLAIIVALGVSIFSFATLEDYVDGNSSSETVKIGIKMKYIIIPIVILLILIGIYTPVKSSVNLYNQNITYLNQYNQKCTERNGFYDKIWKTYLQKNQIASVNKDVFIKTTQIIMEGRSDGPQTTWKWVAENQNIPFDKFSDFYADLSGFIQSQRDAYFDLEKQCMSIANANNTMLQVFPNNLYNKIVGCKTINYKYGFTSNKTDSVFASGKENIK